MGGATIVCPARAQLRVAFWRILAYMNALDDITEIQHITRRLTGTAWELQIPRDQFDLFNIHGWSDVFKKIETKFIAKKNTNTHFNWWWDNLKSDQYSVKFPQNNAQEYLHLIVDPQEKVWFVACDSKKDPTRSWLFEGYIKPIQQILGELNPFEYYVVSKKYDWLLSDHNGSLIGLGSIISNLKALQSTHRIS